MNIVKILKDCPKGTKLYSPIYGDVELLYIDNGDYPINVQIKYGITSFTLDGRFDNNYDGECMLFPSKENRDWSTFKVPKKEYEFKAFEKVLVRNRKSDIWKVDLFSHYNYNSEFHYYTVGSYYECCIPYEGNEHLLGTTNNPD